MTLMRVAGGIGVAVLCGTLTACTSAQERADAEAINAGYARAEVRFQSDLQKQSRWARQELLGFPACSEAQQERLLDKYEEASPVTYEAVFTAANAESERLGRKVTTEEFSEIKASMENAAELAVDRSYVIAYRAERCIDLTDPALEYILSGDHPESGP